MDRYVALDLETSGTDHRTSVPIQLGIALGQDNVYESHVGWPAWAEPGTGGGVPEWSTDAQKIHHIERESVTIPNAPPPPQVDAAASTFMAVGGVGPREGIAVGWNVGTFDMPFVRNTFPHLGAMFSHRCVDLNSVAFSLAQAGRLNPRNGSHAIGAKGWKAAAKRYADDMLASIGAERHDALYDARASLLEWSYFCQAMRIG